MMSAARARAASLCASAGRADVCAEIVRSAPALGGKNFVPVVEATCCATSRRLSKNLRIYRGERVWRPRWSSGARSDCGSNYRRNGFHGSPHGAW